MLEPAYTFILTSRNDDHDPGLRRLKVCLACLFHHMESRGVDSELLLVEWNPPANRPGLADVLPWPTGQQHWTVRAITVSPEVHSQWAGRGRTIPLYVLAARNVGLRRARGQWVLPMNQDCFFTDRLADRLADPSILRQYAFYRAVRADIPPAVIRPAGGVAKILRQAEQTTDIVMHVPENQRKAFTNGSGDFMLMHRSAWEQLRGYPERRLYGVFLDAIQVHMALQAGYKQVIWPTSSCIYHVTHEWGWLPNLFAGLDAMGYPYMSEQAYIRWARSVRNGWSPHIVNGEDWGLGQLALPEREIDVR